ncbi:DUF6760 family protein [Helicovermis profundi]|uniref:DUF6760 family protein n=1 Tax=Helicovermis profundi TaxID=3065157 RepID=UPI0030CB8623
MVKYPEKKLYEEMSFISYYYHWSYEEVMNLEHKERKKWCSEISKINRKVNGDESKKNIFDVF